MLTPQPVSALKPSLPYMLFGVSSRQMGGQNWPQMSAIKLVRARPNRPLIRVLSPSLSLSLSLSLSSSLHLCPASCRFAIVSSAEYTPLNKSIHELPPSHVAVTTNHLSLPPLSFVESHAVVTEIRFTFHARCPVFRPVPRLNILELFFYWPTVVRFREISSP